MNSFSPMPSSNPELFDTKMRSAELTCSRLFNSPLAGTFSFMLIILSCLHDFYGRFTHDHHGHTASVFQNIHRIFCYFLFLLDTLLDTLYRKFACAQAIALSLYSYLFQSLSLFIR